ncbi:MAG: pyruvate dehydrogenase (acetyl-transferring) E1 component subunit alpha [Pseudomonadota bacterium]|nr:pyruvate dehydrogenase (acetyl-transferring) E1 component subunit alpha [Pseudomonadota bacterium]
MTDVAARLLPVSAAHARHLYREMLRIRRFEEKCVELYQSERIRGFLHLYIGEEAVAVGALQAAGPDDTVLATYREHGQALARGVPMDRVMAEMLGKAEGCSRGRGGSMHLFDATRGFYGGNAIVGGHLPLATGMALAEKLRGTGRVAFCFFGEGAAAEGSFHESLNLASLWKLPVLFCCENNLYAMGTALAISEAETDFVAHARSYRVDAEAVDGMDVLAVEAATRRAAAAARTGAGPQLLEFRTYRFRAHSMFDAQLYRDKAEVERWMQRDPLRVFPAAARAEGLLSEADLAAVQAEVDAEVDAAVAYAEAGTLEPAEDLARDVLTRTEPTPRAPARTGAPVKTTFREAIRAAIRQALTEDPRVFLMGEDVAHYGGCYAVTKGLLQEFGPERVRDTPLCENAFVGAAIGAALGGMRPIVEVMTVNFSMLAMDQIVNNAATLRHMSGGQLSVPVVIRMATGAGRQLAAQHSHSLEGWYAHVPGLRVVAPGTLEDARGMLLTALQDPDPVLIFEHVQLYNLEGELPADAGPVDIDHAAVRRAGRDVTLITYGGSLPKALEAAAVLATEGIEAEVVDLRVLRPLDMETIRASVTRTRRAVVIEEAWRSGGFAAEVAARIGEALFWELDAPVGRVCAVEVPVPYPKHLERAALPQVEDIVRAARGAVRPGEVSRG